MAKVIDKHYQNMRNNAKHYEARRIELIKKAKAKGADIDKYWVDTSFDMDALLTSEEVFRSGDIQNIAIPFSDKQFYSFVSQPKHRVGNPIMINNKQKVVHGTYLVGGTKAKPIIYAFSIVRNASEKLQYADFSIKLDMLVSGKEWLPLVRFDSIGEGHPNYLGKDNQVPFSRDKVKSVHGPHLHFNNEATQVVTDDLSYMLATEADIIIRDKNILKDNYLFTFALDQMLEACGLDKKMISKRADSQWHFDHRNYLFDYENGGM